MFGENSFVYFLKEINTKIAKFKFGMQVTWMHKIRRHGQYLVTSGNSSDISKN